VRDEDLKNVPQQIEAWKVREFLDGIGIKHTDVRRLVIEPQSVEVEVYATDDQGRRVRESVDIDVLDLSGDHSAVQGFGGPKMHQIVIPLTQVWDKPTKAEDTKPHTFRPIGRKPDGSLADDCLFCSYAQSNKKAHPNG
jgi:hypothetical protein